MVLSGGNVDLGVVPGLIRRHETRAGRPADPVRPDLRPARRLGPAAHARSRPQGANLVEVEHVREGVELHVRETGVQAVLEVRGRDHAAEVLRAARAAGYGVDEITNAAGA